MILVNHHELRYHLYEHLENVDLIEDIGFTDVYLHMASVRHARRTSVLSIDSTVVHEPPWALKRVTSREYVSGCRRS